MSPLPHDQHHLDKYRAFCELYGITNLTEFVRLYDIYELTCFLPAQPTEAQKLALQAVLGAMAESGYLDYQRSNNTFELIMQWQERTGNFDQHALNFGGGA
ncbi:MAG: hypothetical protein MUC97_11790 [Bernardetiaceae bacterium]|jgi:hypothetical protein|nr:hypothetical protein [Bernardetiaceae bacterium]